MPHHDVEGESEIERGGRKRERQKGEGLRVNCFLQRRAAPFRGIEDRKDVVGESERERGGRKRERQERGGPKSKLFLAGPGRAPPFRSVEGDREIE